MCETTLFPFLFFYFSLSLRFVCSLDAIRSRHIGIPIRHCLSSSTTTSLVDRSASSDELSNSIYSNYRNVRCRSPGLLSASQHLVSALHQLFSGQLSPSSLTRFFFRYSLSLHLCLSSSLRSLSRESRNFISL